jgi:hypothetical protein
MAEFKLGRIKFVWKGNWAGATTYYKDDVVRYGGKTYICSVGHTSDASFYTDLDIVPSKWNEMTDGQSWEGTWTIATLYKVNDVVKYGGSLYICNESHTSAGTTADGLELDQAKWDTYAEGFDWKTNWTISTRYKVNDVVKYGGQTYVCNTGHTSAGTTADGLELDQAKWDYLNKGTEYKGAWGTATRYKVNDVVKYGPNLYIANAAHTSDASDFNTDIANWDQFVEGFAYENTWNNSTTYQPGDVVKYGGNHYVATTIHSGTTPTATGQSDWDLFSRNFDYIGDWAIDTAYKIGEVVTVGSFTYIATKDSPTTSITVTATNVSGQITAADTTGMVAGMAIKFAGTSFGNINIGNTYFVKTVDSGTTFTITTEAGGATFTPDTDTGSMTADVAAHPTNTSYFSKLNEGFRNRGDWTDDTEYEVGDVVRYGDNTYVAVTRHRSEADDGSTIGELGGGAANSRPDIDTTGAYWNQLMTGSETSILTTTGDLVYYGGAGPTRLPIGVEGQVLMAGANYPEWTSLGGSDHVYYVAPHGTDSPYPVFGKTIDKPFKTIRYACEQVLKGPRNTNAQRLLEMNRAFIQRETTEWIDWQVANAAGGSIWDGFDYDEHKCERDTGFIVDALIHDLGHGGNVRMRGAANTYVNGLYETERESYDRISQESANDIAAFNYMLTVVENVLNQTDPSVNYQVTNGDNSTAVVTQFKDATLTAEAGTYDKAVELVTIINNALEDENTDRIPAREQPNNTIYIKTGVYEEVLPIVVPENTALVGDEVRSSTSTAAGSKTHKTDSKYSIETFAHLEEVVSDIIAGSTVTPSASNAESQDIAVPFADTVEQEDIKRLVRGLTHDMDFKLGTKHRALYPDPTDYNTSYLVGYGDARKLVRENKDFFIKETTAYIDANYPNLKYSSTKCEQDVGYIIDALAYDLTYGGKDQSIKAGLAYFDGRNGSGQISATETVATTAAYNNLKSMISTVVQGNSWTALQSDVTVFTDTAGSANSVTHLEECLDIIIATVQDADDTPNATVTTIASNVATTSAAHGMAVGDLFTPRAAGNGFVKGRRYYVKTVPAADEFTVSETFDGSTATLTNGTSLSIVGDIEYRPDYSWGAAGQITAWTTLSAATQNIVNGVVNELAATNWHTDFIVSEDNLTSNAFEIYVGTSDIAHTYVSGGTVTNSAGTEFDISNFVYNESTGIATVTTSTSHSLTAGEVVDITEIVVSCLSSGGTPQQFTYPSATSTDRSVTKVRYQQTKCLRDVRMILDAVGYDLMFSANYNTLVSAYSYLRATAKDVYDLNQKATTRTAFEYVKTQALANVGGDGTAQSKITEVMTLLDDVVYIGSNEGTKASCGTDARNAHNAALQLERNRDFIVAEATAWIADTYTDTVTATSATGNLITISDTSWLTRGVSIEFEGTVVGAPSGPAADDGIEIGTTYYVQDIVSSTTFTISSTRYGTARTMTNDTGAMTVKLKYNSALCERDVGTVIDALKHDIKYPGNFKTRYASRYYANAVIGSHEEDMFYLRNGTGVRNLTLDGLNGDLLPENEYGTSRVSAGAYCSLDPGWGPDDYTAWITSRSPYVQNVATFGYAAVGQKIDGSLHAGGNDSIVSNDFTQLISDGIGAWVTNNARAELVSVFTYYSHIGYLSENGGRIRGTNGNNSYGDFGSVAEGFDDTETINTAIVDNKFQFEATVANVYTDSAEEVYAFEFENAGENYTEAQFLISGAGTGATAEVDDFRNGAVNYVWLQDNIDDSTGAPEAAGNFGGFGYVSNANTAQGGTTTSLTLAATDGELSSAYIGMKLYITGGAGVGQFGIIDSYNAGTKIAGVVKESTGGAGWDHVLPGTAIATPDASSTYIVEPRIQFSAPGFDAGTTSTINTTGNWNKVKFVYTSATYLPSSFTYAGNGSGASFQVIKNGSKYEVSVLAGGSGYERLQTVTIDGGDVGGATSTNDITVTIVSVDTDGEILEIEWEGQALEGKWIAVKASSNVAAVSSNGTSWASSTLPSTQTWTDIESALIDDGSSVAKQSRIVAIGTGTNAAAWSNNGTTWNPAVMPASANWTSVTYGEGRFVAIADDSTTVAISLDGVEWDITGTLPGTGYDNITYGQGMFIAIESGSTNSAYSTDGESWTAGGALPASSNWSGLAYGRNIFIAVADGSTNGAYSIDKGLNWTAMTVGNSFGALQGVQYGQGMFVATVWDSGGGLGTNYVMSSQDGINWTQRTCANAGANSGFADASAGVINGSVYWVGVIGDTGTDQAVRFEDGATAKGRAAVADNKIFQIRITDPGSGYATAPTITVTDPSEIYAVPTEVRIGNGVIANPSFTSRGTGYESSSADLVGGDGYAFFYQEGSFIAIRQLTQFPVTGSNVVFGHLPNQTFKLVNILTLRGTNDGSYTCFFQVSPDMKRFSVPDHGDTVQTRIRYSQVRLTGHDFLDIGTGNFVETNYPGLPTQDPIQSQETKESNGGRVFFTTTDQDGNFRVGNLFAVEQSTGVATLNADAFNIAGLQELSLGEVTLGGGSASIDEFSTDPFFTQDSDSVVPTQRAIKAYISSQIGGGGASLNVNSVTAGFVRISGTTITSDTGASIQVNATLDFRSGVRGYPLAWNYFLT